MTQSIPIIWYLAPASSILSLIVAYFLSKKLLSADEGTDKMKEIAGYVKDGAMAYLKRQYRVVAIVVGIIFILLGVLAFIGVQRPYVPILFLSGSLWSAVCGYLGMKTATNASARTAHACRDSLNKGLTIAFRGGAVMGLIVVGFALLDLSIWFFVLNFAYDSNFLNWGSNLALKLGQSNWTPEILSMQSYNTVKFSELTAGLLSYAMGASVVALFARVGGGIFTKAADVGADLVGKVEAGIPEDDPRNPATIADNVGDNVGDVAGMGADLYESYCGSILAATALGASLVLSQNLDTINPIIMPMVVAAGGILFSLVGIFFVKTKDGASQQSLLHSLLIGTGISSVLTLGFVALLAYLGFMSWGVFGAVITGLISGLVIGQATEYYTACNFSPVKKIVAASLQGSATTILQGFSTGMLSSGIPVLVIVVAIMVSFGLTGGFHDLNQGIYGIAFAAIGMLSTLGIQLATDAFGPIADNAGGNAEMAGLPSDVRERTDALDALGNTTAATGKGFAIGSAALTALALIAAYLDSIKHWLTKLAGDSTHYIGNIGFTSNKTNASEVFNINFIESLSIKSLVQIFEINAVNPKFLAGLFIGGMVAFVFCALTIIAVGDAAGEMVKEVRRQFREIKGILEGTAKPDYERCITISTTGALRAMLLPSLLAIITPIVVGLVFHIPGIIGLLMGALSTGFVLAITLNNSGGAWDNAKKYVETGHNGGKGTDSHKATVVGDTVGDPFKDTAGPSLNILIKLMTIVSIVFAGVILKFGFYF
ncbi:sodium-translocating pyrophosphatase [bacterium]|nr:sodium-translocating pyrophosphatase [bacterium]